MKAYKNIPSVLRYFYSVAWKYEKRYFAAIVVNMIVTGFAPFINIFIPKLIIDELLGAKRVDTLAPLVATLVLLNLAAAVANNVTKYVSGKSVSRLEYKFKEILAAKCLSMDFGSTENADTLNQKAKAERGMSWYSGGIDGLTQCVTTFVSAIITLAGTVYIIGTLSPLLFAALIAITVVNMLFVSKMSKGSAQFVKDMVDINRKFSYYCWGLKRFNFGKDIRIYNAAPLISQRADKYIKEDWFAQRTFNRKQNRYGVATTFLTAAQSALVYGYFAVRAVKRLITVGEFQMLVTAALSFATALRSLVEIVINLAKVADFMIEYIAFLKIPDTMRGGKRSVEASESHIIEFRDVSFKYPNAEDYSLRNVSITLEPGKKLSVVGRNGAGKTTFIKLLCRLYEPTDGEILLDGVNIAEYALDSYRKLMSVVFQDYKLLAFTLRENIAAADGAELSRVIEAVGKAGFDERLQALENGLNTSVYKDFDANGVEFSGGESQKIAIARAVCKNAPITVLDEPTAALDPMAEYEIYKRFDSLVGGAAAIYISHRLSSCRFCDSIAVFNGGGIVQYGSHDELVRDASGEYAAMWSAQARYYE
jgi:ABC-type multidrug transport system fused ATPase/permease subunit